MDELMAMFRPGIQPSSVAKRLYDLAKSNWRQGDEEEQWAFTAIQSLLKRLKKEKGQVEKLEHALTFPDQPSECVTIPRSLDGRLQVNHRKGLPHVIYCRVWRWPELQTRQELESLPCCHFPYSSKQTEICVNPYHYCRTDPGLTFPPVLVPRKKEYPNEGSKWFSRVKNVSGVLWQRAPISHSGYGETPYATSPIVNRPMPLNPYGCISEEQMQIDTVTLGNGHPNHLLMPPGNDCMEVDMMANNNNTNPLLSPTVELLNWCTISYYELNSRIGEIFYVPTNTPSVVIDGFTNPTGNRICLGQVSNVNRTHKIQEARDSIGHGIELTFHKGEVYVKCRSENAIFVQSTNSNYFRGFHPSTVCKVPPKFSLKIFDPESFKQALLKAVEAYSDRTANDGDRPSQEAEKLASDAEKMCLIRISFARGWGAGYQRADITSTPCWIEIRLNHPLQWYDRMIVQRRRPLLLSSLT